MSGSGANWIVTVILVSVITMTTTVFFRCRVEGWRLIKGLSFGFTNVA